MLRTARRAALVLAGGLLVAGCTTGEGHTIPPRKGRLLPAATTSTTEAAVLQPTTAPTSSTPAVVPGPDNMKGNIATPIGDPVVRDGPSDAASPLPFPKTNAAGAPTTFAVIGDPTGPWIQVLLPDRPNGHVGWVPADSVKITTTTLAVHVDLEARKLTITKAGNQVFEAPIAIGTESNPTPTGATYVTELIENTKPNGAYGPYAYGLALHSDTLTEFGGGDGQVGIHGTNTPKTIGQRVSHGCVRLKNDDIRGLLDQQLPLGVPVFIT